MGRKVNPIVFRIGTTRTWSAKWHAGDKEFKQFLMEDLKLRKTVSRKYGDAAISNVDIERGAEDKITITLHTARPGMVIGRGGSRVEEIRKTLNDAVGNDKKVQLNIKEITRPELDAYLVARSIAEQVERRVAYRRAMKQAIFRTMQAGAFGIKIVAAGRLGGVEIARKQVLHQGRVPLQTLRADVDYGLTRAHTAMGDIGIKVWIYRGDVLPEQKPQAEFVVSENIPTEETVKMAKRTPKKKNESVDVPVVKEQKAAKTTDIPASKVTRKPKVEATVEESTKVSRVRKPKTEEPSEATEEAIKPKRTRKPKSQETTEE